MPKLLRRPPQARLHGEVEVNEEVLGIDGWGVNGVCGREVDAAPGKGQEKPHGRYEKAAIGRCQRLAERHFLLEDQVMLDAK